MTTMRAYCPGRVNLIGDHTDYTGGFVLPMAIDLGTEVVFTPDAGTEEISFESRHEPGSARVDLSGRILPGPGAKWVSYLSGIVKLMAPGQGGKGQVRSSLPVGAGLSSSAALELSLALSLGFSGTSSELALLGQRAEHEARGVECGIMDQLACSSGQAGHAMLIDCSNLEIKNVPMPNQVEVVVVHSGEGRSLAASAYGRRRQECNQATRVIGSLRHASADSLSEITDPVIRRRARHVISENTRVLAAASALQSGDLATLGQAMAESHRSLAGDFEVSTSKLDTLVDDLQSIPGVWGARLTGAGFGGCVVAMARPGVLTTSRFRNRAWIVRSADGARLIDAGGSSPLVSSA